MVEAYVRRRLAPEDCAAFEEHYFECSQCFDDVQVTEKLVQGVDYAVRSGLLDRVPATVKQEDRSQEPGVRRKPAPMRLSGAKTYGVVFSERKGWLLPAFAFAAAASVFPLQH
jgi:anti-sigma factor RsiW